jgi:hypothetical protein
MKKVRIFLFSAALASLVGWFKQGKYSFTRTEKFLLQMFKGVVGAKDSSWWSAKNVAAMFSSNEGVDLVDRHLLSWRLA